MNGSKFLIGDFVNAIISFLLIAAAVYFFVVLPVNAFRKQRMGVFRSADDHIKPI